MMKKSVVFVGFTEYDNLGIGYMSSLLLNAGFTIRVIDLRKSPSEILKIIKNLDPLIIGFSVIFRNHLQKIIDLITYLRRESGTDCHFTAGGHYASLKHQELFQAIPLLDSIVRFEGEYTMLELADCLETGSDWKNIMGIAYKSGNKIISNECRPLEKDLDKFPFPHRLPLKKYAFEVPFATMIAGRGCFYDCSFCNTRKFYSEASGPVKRIRKPEMVVKEMEMLYHQRKCPIFIFLDDDFPVKYAMEPEWIEKFGHELEKKNLSRDVMWKICCRADEVDEEKFALMKEHGLSMVFLGIEDGTDEGLANINKHLTIEDTFKSINILKKLNLAIDFGFMPFHPSSTYKSLNENMDFLRQLFGDGYSPVTFVKMMPLYETRIEAELQKEGRLKINSGIPDYEFHEQSLNSCYNFISECFTEWLQMDEGLENISSWARNDFYVFYRFIGSFDDVRKLNCNLTAIISESNLFMLDTIKELLHIFESGSFKTDGGTLLNSYRNTIKLKHSFFRKSIINNRELLHDLALEHIFDLA